ncbi:Zinc finger protein 26 [Operophtera brumata]|uniref:Zinc finger protein 26 n=1 Tax=Operophtera brumata TaxID=104452 RepID=A0A0L7LEF8_OPEBR|nr:Zinc finger protein 26 [Operophtera brumata]
MCGKTTSSRAAMAKHNEIHGEKKYSCDVDSPTLDGPIYMMVLIYMNSYIHNHKPHGWICEYLLANTKVR